MERSGSGVAAAGYASSEGDSPSPSPSGSPSAQLHGGGAGDEGTPGSATTGAGGTTGSPHVAGPDGVDPKKLRACEACRGLKVRCEPDPNEGPCKRCKKAGRSCVVTAPTRKRQKKTDSRVSELEKKIDALTASLQARTGGLPPAPPASQYHHQQPQSEAPREAPNVERNRGNEHRNWDSEVAQWDSTRPADQDSPFQQLISMAGRKRKAMEEGESQDRGSSSQQGGQPSRQPRPLEDDRRPSAAAASVGWPAFTSRSADGDVVDRGTVPLSLAAALFSRYKSQMVRHLPGVVFPPSTTISELRRTKPILFLAIMAAAAGEDHALQRVLQKELMQIFAQKVIVTGEKSLELVQALNVAVIWYWPPEYFEELKFYQLIHTAAVMAIDIGLGRKGSSRNRRGATAAGGATAATPIGMGWRGDPTKKAPPPDPTTLESRRTWLTCYYLASNTAMSLHRPHLLRWTAFMQESMDLLRTSVDAAPTDEYFCHLVWTHHLGEQISTQLSMDDPDAVVDIADARTQYALRALERDLERYRGGVARECLQATLKIAFDLLNLYMHETVLHADQGTDVGGGGGGFNAEGLRDGLVRDAEQPLSAQHVNALTSCLSAINGIFDTFLALPVESIRCLPVFNFVRVAYAVVVLMKMYFSASSVGSDLGQVFTRDSMRVREHLDALLDKFRATAAEDRCRPASKFLVVLAMLRSWFVKQGSGRTDGAGDNNSTAENSNSNSNNNNSNNSNKTGNGAQNTNRSGRASMGQTQHQQQQGISPHQQQQQHPHTSMPPQTANTPLQLLSEVATSNPGSGSASEASPFPYYRQQQQQPGFYPDTTTSPNGVTESDAAAASSLSSAAAAGGFPPWVAEAMLANTGFDGGGGGGGGEFPTAMGMGAIEGFDARGVAAATNDQFWTDMFQGIPDPNMFTF